MKDMKITIQVRDIMIISIVWFNQQSISMDIFYFGNQALDAYSIMQLASLSIISLCVNQLATQLSLSVGQSVGQSVCQPQSSIYTTLIAFYIINISEAFSLLIFTAIYLYGT